MRTLGDRVTQIADKHEEETELEVTPLNEQIEKFYRKWGKDYQPIFREDLPTSVYDEQTK